MNDYVITCTSVTDLDAQILKDREVPYVCFKMIMNGKEYADDFFESYPYEQFYDDIAKGMMPTTSQAGWFDYQNMFESILKEGKDVLHITVSSALSGDHSGACLVAEELNRKYENQVTVIDSLGASSGYGLLVMLAKDNQEKGMSYEDNCRWVKENRLRIHHWFISTDLSSFIRGGRLSKAAGLVGTALKICPLMNVSAQGSLNVSERIRTKKRALEALLLSMSEYADFHEDYDGPVYLCQSRMEEDAQQLKEKILERFPKVKDVRIFRIGTTIGAHTGPGTVALFFLGENRK